jgi:hypothetical protein
VSGEGYPTGGNGIEVGDLGADFASIIKAGLDPAYVDGPAATESLTTPFGSFTEDVSALDTTRAPLATSTGYTGPNAEESA